MELAAEVARMPLAERVIIVDILLFGRAPAPSSDDVGNLVDRIRSGDLANSDVERIATSIAARTPPRDRDERDFVIRQFVRRFGAMTASTASNIRWLQHETLVFSGGGDWRRERHRASCSFPDERRLLLWRVLKFGDLPSRSALFEILNPDQ